jgi:molybdate transport system substrate-binding protein
MSALRACLLVLLALAGCRATPSPSPFSEILVFAAASTSEVMTDLGREFHDASGDTARFSFGASRDLARQVRAGAPADVFVSADAETVDGLIADKLAQAADRRRLASNRLVVVVPKGSSLGIAQPGDLSKAPHLALGDPAVVPAGAYAKKWLEGAGLWESVREHVVPTLDVRAALAAVESGRAEAGVVYATDASTSERVRIAFEVARAASPEIVYVAARLSRSTSPASVSFLNFLTGAEGRRAFARRGFVVEDRAP